MSQVRRALVRVLSASASAGVLVLLATSSIADHAAPAAEPAPLLVEGEWRGLYNLLRSGRNNASFKVKQSRPGVWEIKMKIDLQPKDKFTFALEEIELGDDTLSFAFGKKGQVRECKLERKPNDSLAGACFHRSDPSEEVQASIEMWRPVPDVAAGPQESDTDH